MKYYVNQSTGAYIGGYSDGLDPPANSVETPAPPSKATQVWDFTNQVWLAAPAEPNMEGFIQTIAYSFATTSNPPDPPNMFYYFDALRFSMVHMTVDQASTIRKAVWAQIKSGNPEWLTTDYTTKVESWAASFNVDLV